MQVLLRALLIAACLALVLLVLSTSVAGAITAAASLPCNAGIGKCLA